MWVLINRIQQLKCKLVLIFMRCLYSMGAYYPRFHGRLVDHNTMDNAVLGIKLKNQVDNALILCSHE